MQNILDIHTEATQAAKNAVGKFLADWTSKTGGNEYGEPMYCGFAWVDVAVTRTNDATAKALSSVGFRKSYRPKTMTLWDPAQHRGQSMTLRKWVRRPMLKCYRSMAYEQAWDLEQTKL